MFSGKRYWFILFHGEIKRMLPWAFQQLYIIKGNTEAMKSVMVE